MTEWTQEKKRRETLSMIRDYDNLLAIVETAPEEFKELYGIMVSPRSSRITGMPSVHNPQAGETAMAARLDALAGMQTRYNTAKATLVWFEPMWNALTDEERDLLESFKFSSTHSGYLAGLAAKLGYSERQTRRLRDKALDRLVGLLFYAM